MESYRITVTDLNKKEHTFLFADYHYYGQVYYPRKYEYPQDIKDWKKKCNKTFYDLKKVKIEKVAISIPVINLLYDFQNKLQEYAHKTNMHYFGKVMKWDINDLVSDKYIQYIYTKAILLIIKELPLIKGKQTNDPWLVALKKD